LNEEEFKRKFNGDFVFVCDMGDIFSPGVRDEWIVKVLEHVRRFLGTTFLLLTKNPRRYWEFLDKMPRNTILGATIETDDDELYHKYKISRAPLPSERIKAMIELPWDKKFVAVEPILDFTPKFAELLAEIKPILIYVGYDNYNNRLPEPPLVKTRNFILDLRRRGVNVREKTLRYAWYEQYKRRSSGIVNIGENLKIQLKDYESLKDYLNIMNERALQIYYSLNDDAKKPFTSMPSRQKEHYWTLKKLISLAMYIPMFIQIGRNYFDRLIYVDTHAGPGLARIGNDDRDWVLGSPLIALEWPKIVASRNKKFQKIAEGFDELYLIEKDHETASTLKKIVEEMDKDNKVKIYPGDVNNVLYTVKKDIECKSEKNKTSLILMFIDPPGNLESQIRYDVLTKFINGIKVDIVYNVMSSFIARALNSINSEKILRDRLNDLWGNICVENSHLEICACISKTKKCKIKYGDIVYVYEFILKNKLKYKKVKMIPVDFHDRTLYHILVASKGDGWLDGYEEYITTRIPSDYIALKNLFLQATRRLGTLADYLYTKSPHRRDPVTFHRWMQSST
jgi:three-Cys-motif partner protein